MARGNNGQKIFLRESDYQAFIEALRSVRERYFPRWSDKPDTTEIAEKIDQQAIADQLTQLDPEILAKY